MGPAKLQVKWRSFTGVWSVITLSAFRAWSLAPCLPSANSCLSLLKLLLEVSATLTLSLIYSSHDMYLMPALSQLLGMQRLNTL